MQAKNTYPEAEDAASMARTQTRDKLDQAATKVHDTVDRVHRRAVDMTDNVSTQGERMYADACNWISAHPLQAVAGALLAGYLFGRIRS